MSTFMTIPPEPVGSRWGLAALQAADAEQRTRGSTVQPIFEIGERRPYCAPNLGLGWSHARLGAMNGTVLRSTQRVSHSFRLPLTRMVLTVVLLVVCAQVTLSFRAMTIAAQADRQMLPPSTAAPLSLFPTETTYDAGAECCPSATFHCIQTCSAVQTPDTTGLQTLAAGPLWWQLATVWLRANAVRIPTPPPKA